MRIVRWILVALGCAAMLYALTGVLAHRDLWPGWFRFLVAVMVGHELIAMPLALAIGVLIGRFAARHVRAVLQAAVFASAVITVIALPGIVGAGVDPNLPSALPRHYGRGLLIVLAVIWIVLAVIWCAAITAILYRRRLRNSVESA